MTKPRIFLMAAVFFLCIPFHAWTAEKSLQKVSFIPQWVPQAQFAGYYMAYEKGIYKRYGMDLTIIPGGPEKSPSDLLKKGDADFCHTLAYDGHTASRTGYWGSEYRPDAEALGADAYR